MSTTHPPLAVELPEDANELPAGAFEILAKSDLFLNAEPDVVKWLRGPALRRYYRWLKSSIAIVTSQLRSYELGAAPFQGDRNWLYRATNLQSALMARKPEIAELVSHQDNMPKPHTDGERRELARLLGATRRAIHEHRRASETAGLDPEPHDTTLWAILEKPADPPEGIR